jgi:hypothetical protein
VAITHLGKQRVELVDAGQRNLFSSNRSTFQSRCGIAVNYTSFDCDPENMPKQRDCVVVVSRRCSFGIRTRPFLAIRLRDFAHLGFAQTLPAFLQRGKALSPVMARARFDADIVIEIVEMNRSGLAEGHLGRDLAVAVTNALTVFFKKFRELGLRYAEMRCLERLPNFFAASKSSGIVAPGLMTDEILEPRFFPCFRRFALFHKADRRIAP